MTKISDERLAEMLVGLESATPGPWEVVGSSITDWGREWDASMSMEFVPNGHDEGMNSRSDEDSAHIARCDPDTIRSLITELQHLRAHNSDSAEPVAWTCIAGYDGHFWRTTDPESGCEVNAYTGDQKTLFERRRSALASPPAKEVERLREALMEIRELNTLPPDENGHRWDNSDLIAQTIMSALTNRTPDDEVGNG